MNEYPTITRIRPIAASSARSERKGTDASSAKRASAEGGASGVIALGSLIIGLWVSGAPQRRS